MNPYYFCERLKINRLFVRKASIYISLISILIIFILSTLDCISGFSKMLIALLLMAGYTIVVQKYLLKID